MGEFISEESVKCNADERFLGTMEFMFMELGNLEPPSSNYFHVNVLHSQKEITECHVRESFYELTKSHVLLQARCVLTDTGDYLFQKVPQFSQDSSWINIQSVEVTSKDEWLSVVTENIKVPFAISEGPLWRLLWLSVCSEEAGYDYVLVIISSHTIIDVKSCMDLVHAKFLPLLNDAISGEKFQSMHGNNIKLAYPFEKIFLDGIDESNYAYMKYEVPWYVKMVANCALWLHRKGFFSMEKPRYRDLDEKNPQGSTSFFPFSIERTQSEMFIELCRINKVSVQSVLTVLLANCFCKAANSFPCFDFDGIINFVIDFRKFNKELCTSPMPLGTYAYGSHMKCQEEDVNDRAKFFQYCRKIKYEIEKRNKPKISMSYFSFFNYLSKSMRLDEIFRRLRKMSLSNAGNFDYVNVSNSSVMILEQYFSTSLEEGEFYVNTLTYNGTMFFCFAMNGKWFSNNFAQFIVNELRNSIYNIVKK